MIFLYICIIMARPSEYNFEMLKQYKGIDVIYGLYIDNDEFIKYVGYSKNIYQRFKNHIRNHESEPNTKKFNWINKYNSKIKVKILSVNPTDWQSEEIKFIEMYSKNDLLNICIGGKNNIHNKNFSDMSCKDHLIDINKSLKELNNYYKSKRKNKVFKLFSKEDMNKICSLDINQ